MPAFISLVGEKFGMLTVLSRAPNRGKYTIWKCRCDCGVETLAYAVHLKKGATKTCGCKASNLTHGLSTHTLYPTWNLMMARCYNKNHDYYYRYGGRGILVQDSWHDCSTFINELVELIGVKPEGDYQLDRINNDGNYCAGNVQWSTRTDNCRNRHDTIMIMYKGELQPLQLVAELCGISYNTLNSRRRGGWAIDKMFTKPRQLL